jgi:Protein of unknown function (DUF1242)
MFNGRLLTVTVNHFLLLEVAVHVMSAIFDFSSLITVLLLLICTCAYLRELRPKIFDSSDAVSTLWSCVAPVPS